MGLLALGTPLEWKDAKQHADYVREHGIVQFLHIWERLKDRTGDVLLWGDEIEYMVISYDDAGKNAKLSLRQTEILLALQQDATERKQKLALDNSSCSQADEACIPVFHPEYGRYMLESTPGAPYGATLDDLREVEGNMRFRRELARAKMHPNEVPLTLTSFPRMGAPGQFTEPFYPTGGPVARSLFLPDEITNPHVRFPTLTANIRRRRGEKVAMNMPIFVDQNTPQPFIDPTVPRDRDQWPEDANAREGAAQPNHIYMDAMGFGMGCCCLQITFQACSVGEARRMYDGFVPVGPIMLALTAAAPIFRGLLADVDCRWDVIAGSVDDRTREERGVDPLEKDRFVIPKSRYDSVDCYIYDSPINRPEYNDNDMPIDSAIRQRLIDAGVDDKLATHFAHLFIRDPIVIFEETMQQDDANSSDHFENIQSTNWQTVRFKPPPPGSPIGWRVEFRSMEVQLTDYENAAYAVFIVLLTRAIMQLGLNLYIPISKVDENMHRAHRRDAVNTQKFFFRKNLFDPAPGVGCSTTPASPSTASSESHLPSSSSLSNGVRAAVNGFATGHSRMASECSSHHPSRAGSPSPSTHVPAEFGPIEDEYAEFTLNEIINGDGAEFPGLIGVIRKYLDSQQVSTETRADLERSLSLISRKASGELITTATWMRRFVQSHPSYKGDSVVSEEINYDLVKALDALERGTLKAPELLPAEYVGSAEKERMGKDSFKSKCGQVVEPDLSIGAEVSL